MNLNKFSIAHPDEEMMKLVSNTDQKILARWAIDCAERVMPMARQFMLRLIPQKSEIGSINVYLT